MKRIEAKELTTAIDIAIIVSRFNEKITEPLLAGALERLQELEVRTGDVTVVHVPGAVEIPLVAKRLAEKNHYDVIIALGAVIRGETSHYDYVCTQVSEGCQQVMLEQDVPIIFGLLTTENVEQAQARIGGKHGHKGREAADAAVEMVSILQQLA